MGVAITDLLHKEETDLSAFSHKTIAVDASLMLYQFLSSIRQPDGTPLQDSTGRITSHIIGISSRVTKLMQKDIKLVFVFDGKAPESKKDEQQRRHQLKEEAMAKYHIAVEKEDTKDMRKYASRTTSLTKPMIEEAKEFLMALGIPCVQAPSEAEAQAAAMVKAQQCYAVATQDADCLMFGSPRIIRNLSVAGKRKRTGKLAFESIQPELISLEKTLQSLGINQDQFIVLCMLVGTDYNRGGIKGIGPKKALDLVKKYPSHFSAVFHEAEWENHNQKPWEEVMAIIKGIPTQEVSFTHGRPDKAKVQQLLQKYEFSQDRIVSILDRLQSVPQQRGLSDFL